MNHGYCKNCFWHRWNYCFMQDVETNDNSYCPDYYNRKREKNTLTKTINEWIEKKQCSKEKINEIIRKYQKKMTHKERNEYVSGKFLECIKEINTVRKGNGCKPGEHYWFEYVYNEQSDTDGFYRKLSDNNHYDEVIITDKELLENFVEC